MRWPVQRQLLVPMLSVVVAALVVSSVVNAYLSATWTRRRQREDLHRVIATLTTGGFPLTQAVLEKMSGLSGAHFVVLDRQGRLEAATVEPSSDDLDRLRKIEGHLQLAADLAENPALTIGGQSFLCDRVHVTGRMAVDSSFSLVVLYPEDRWWSERRRAVYPPLVVGSASVAAAILISAWLARRLVRPIQRLRRQASAIAAGDFSQVPLTSRDDEIRDLEIALNEMADQLARSEQRVRSHERLRTLGQLGGGIAHQLRNSVTGARLALDLYRGEAADPDDESLSVIDRQLKLMQTYLQRFLALGRTTTQPPQPVDLGNLVSEVVELVAPAALHAHVQLDWEPPVERLVLPGDVDSLRQLLVNLALNAVEAAAGHRPGAAVKIELNSLDDGHLELCIQDNGPGPAEHIQSQLFEPFVSEKADGTGLGLAVAQQIAQQHGGRVLWRRVQDWTWFIVRVPIRAEVEHGITADH